MAMVRQTTRATATVMLLFPMSRRSTSRILQKQAAASTVPQHTAVRISFQIT